MGKVKLADRWTPRRKKEAKQVTDLPPGCTWILVLGLQGDQFCKRNGERFEAEVARRGFPFVLVDEGVDCPPGAIPVKVLYGDRATLVHVLRDAYKLDKDRMIAPFVAISSLASGETSCANGMQSPEQCKQTFDLALAMRARASS